MPIPSSCDSEGGGGGGGAGLSSMPKNFHTASSILPSAMVVNIERVIVTPKQMASRLIFLIMPAIVTSLVSPGKGSLTLNRVRLLIAKAMRYEVNHSRGR